MKVLFVSSGNNIYLFTPFIKSQGESLIKEGMEIEYFPIRGKGIIGYVRAIFKLRHFLRINHIDLIHAHFGLCGWVAQLARRKEKLIVSFMGDDIVGSNYPGGGIKPISRFIAKINCFMAKWFYDSIIVKSLEMLNKFGKTSSNYSVIPNGVDLKKFFPITKQEARSKLSLSESLKIIVFVADPSRIEKNFTLAEKAFCTAKISDAILLPIFNKCVEDLPFYFSAADLLLLTSYHEGSPNVVKEAMACNCPIVSTDVGDVRWVLGDTEGCYIGDFNPEDIAAKIKLALYFDKRTKGRERIIELELDSDKVAKRIVELYNKVIDGRK